MRTTSALKTAALLIAAVVLALGTVQGSLAAWNTSTSVGAGSVKAADFKVMLNAGSATGPQRLSVDGVPATVALPAITNLKPGDTRTIPVTVTNATDAGNGVFRIRLTATAPTRSGPTAPELAVTAGLSSTAGCATRTETAIDLPQDTSATLCITVSLAENAPASLAGQSNGIGIKLTAAQL